jgi:hypothetical protein
MIPPTRCQSGSGYTPHYDPEAPLSEWELGRHFSAKGECESFLNKARHQPTDPEGHREAEVMRCLSDGALLSAKRPG